MSTDQIRILIVDDEPAIVKQLVQVLKSNPNYDLLSCSTGQDGLRQIEYFRPHLLLLDLGLPDMSGLEVLSRLRKWSLVPVIVLTVQDNENIKVQVLDSGADDFLCKPFGTAELMARIRVALRNHSSIEATPQFVSGELQVNLNAKTVKLDDKEIHLSRTEFDLLALLVRQPGQVIAQKQLLKEIWHTTSDDQSHYLRIYINQLRKKIEKNPSEPKHILTEPGVGYRIV